MTDKCQEIYTSVPVKCGREKGHTGPHGAAGLTRVTSPYLSMTVSLTVDGETPSQVKHAAEDALRDTFLEATVTKLCEREPS